MRSTLCLIFVHISWVIAYHKLHCMGALVLDAVQRALFAAVRMESKDPTGTDLSVQALGKEELTHRLGE